MPKRSAGERDCCRAAWASATRSLALSLPSWESQCELAVVKRRQTKGWGSSWAPREQTLAALPERRGVEGISQCESHRGDIIISPRRPNVSPALPERKAGTPPFLLRRTRQYGRVGSGVGGR